MGDSHNMFGPQSDPDSDGESKSAVQCPNLCLRLLDRLADAALAVMNIDINKDDLALMMSFGARVCVVTGLCGSRPYN